MQTSRERCKRREMCLWTAVSRRDLREAIFVACAITLSHYHTITLSHYHTITLSHHHTITPLHYHTITPPSHYHTMTLSHPPGPIFQARYLHSRDTIIVSMPKRSALEASRRELSEDVSFGVGAPLGVEQSGLEDRPRGM